MVIMTESSSWPSYYDIYQKIVQTANNHNSLNVLPLLPIARLRLPHLVSKDSRAMSDPFLPFPLEHLPLARYVLALPMFFVIAVVALVLRLVLPLEHPPSLHPPLDKRTPVLPLSSHQSPLTMELVRPEVTLVTCTVCKTVRSLSVLATPEKLPPVLRLVPPELISKTVGVIIKPLPVIVVAQLLIDHFSLPLSHIVPHLSLVIAPLTVHVPPVSMRKAMRKGSSKIRTVLKVELPHPVRFVILPFALVYGP